MITPGAASPRGQSQYETQEPIFDSSRLIDGEFQTPRNGRKNDKAHPPIHPTAHAGNLEGEERKVFELVARRFLASCHKNAEGKTTTVEIDIAGEEFSTSGQLRRLQRGPLDSLIIYRPGRPAEELPRSVHV